MNRHQSELLIFVGILTAFLLGLLLAWLGLPVLTREMRLGLVIIVALLLAGAAFWLNRLVQAHRFGLRRLAEELELILRSNPAHRVRPGTLATEKRLATAVNTFADRYQQQLAAEAEKMTQAQAALAAEKQRLAALIADMGEGVLVCNREGQILLFNGRSQHLLDTPDQSGSLVGLGRSILALFDRQVIAHVLEEAATRPETRRVVQFTATASNGRLLRLRLVPVAAESEAETGFIVTLEDLTQQQAQQLDQRLWPLVEGLRAPAANIRAAIETVMDYAAMPADQRQRLQQVVYEEAGRLSETVEELTAVYNSHPPANLQLDPMLGRDLLWALERRLRPLGAVAATLPPDDLWLLADSYLLRHVVLFLAEKLVAQWQPHHLELRLQPLRQRAALDLVWVADESVEPVWAWLDETIPALGQTARQVTAHHDGELWVQREGATAFVRLLLPLTVWESTPLPLLGSRPEYYDFDLLQRPLPAADWAERPLRELTYTVFDTETTG
ncbi:MAG: PAS-domain containing protein, partial [Anaerolineales bacterium]|nr:PAS-domain containing protein [Anaerolineales bacterium]